LIIGFTIQEWQALREGLAVAKFKKEKFESIDNTCRNGTKSNERFFAGLCSNIKFKIL
jgi:hypothetical protein